MAAFYPCLWSVPSALTGGLDLAYLAWSVSAFSEAMVRDSWLFLTCHKFTIRVTLLTTYSVQLVSHSGVCWQIPVCTRPREGNGQVCQASRQEDIDSLSFIFLLYLDTIFLLSALACSCGMDITLYTEEHSMLYVFLPPTVLSSGGESKPHWTWSQYYSFNLLSV